jgi:hypothetical protein
MGTALRAVDLEPVPNLLHNTPPHGGCQAFWKRFHVSVDFIIMSTNWRPAFSIIPMIVSEKTKQSSGKEKIPLFFLFFFVPLSWSILDCSSQETANCKIRPFAIFTVVFYNK